MGLPTPLFHLISSPKKKGKPERSGNRGGNSAVGLVRGPGSERHSGRRMPLYSSNSGGIAGEKREGLVHKFVSDNQITEVTSGAAQHYRWMLPFLYLPLSCFFHLVPITTSIILIGSMYITELPNFSGAADLGKVLATFETTIDPALSNRHLARSGNQASLWIKIGYSPRHHNEQMMRMDRDDWWKKPHYINHMFYRNNDRFLVMEIWPSS